MVSIDIVHYDAEGAIVGTPMFIIHFSFLNYIVTVNNSITSGIFDLEMQ